MSSTMEPRTGSKLPSTSTKGANQSSVFRDEEHALGLALSEMTEPTMRNVLKRGGACKKAERLLAERGRSNLMPVFMATYLPAVDEKSIARSGAAYDAFHSLLPLDDSQAACAEIESFRLGAIYRLSRPDATAAHRKELLALAKAGGVVTEEIATSLIKRDVDQSVTSRRPRKRTIALRRGTIEIRVEDDDVVGALREALANQLQKLKNPEA